MVKQNVNKRTNIIKTTMKVFKELENVKLCCKVSIIDNMNYIKENNDNSKDVKNISDCTMSCLECIEMCDVCQYFIASKSTNIDKCISFMIVVLNTCIKSCKKADCNPHLKQVNINTTAKQCQIFIKSLRNLKTKI